MATDDSPKLPRATLRDEKLYVDGEKEPYFQDREDTILLRVSALTIYRGYAPEQTSKAFVEALYGVATLEDGDRFAVIGLETDPTILIRFNLQSVPDTETKWHWRASISFHPHYWEDPDRPECFSILANCTSQYFDDLLAAVRRGHVDHIRVGMKTAMWTKDKLSMVRRRRTWHLAPPIDHEPATKPSYAIGNISSLTWEEKFGPREPKAEDKTTAPKPQLVELPGRVYSMLSALLAIAAALLVLTFLRL